MKTPMRPTRTPMKTPQRSRDTSVARNPILVYCRVRPCDRSTDEVCLTVEDEKTVKLIPPEKNSSLGKTQVTVIESSFERVFPPTTSQKEFFNHVAKPLVADLLSGVNGLLFTYGITSSGKTFTMSGTGENSGLLPRTLDAVFNSIPSRIKQNPFIEKDKNLNARFPRTPKTTRIETEWSNRVPDNTIINDVDPNKQYRVFVTYIEIYKNYVYDLLEEFQFMDRKKARPTREIKFDRSGRGYVEGANEKEIMNTDEALKLFDKGQKNRRIGSTCLNDNSSRSHCVFTIRLLQSPIDSPTENVQCSQLSLVDLAGSERHGRTKASQAGTKEAGNINNSLGYLRRCIDFLRGQSSEKIMPYRYDKLLFMFKSYFEGDGKIRMIVCVNPHVDNAKELVQVLEFSEKTREVQIQRAPEVSRTPIYAPITRTGRGGGRRPLQGPSDTLSPAVYTLGPEFPNLSVSLSDDEEVYDNIIQFLETRINRRSSLRADLHRRQNEFRTLLVTLESENRRLVQENSTKSADLEHREQQFRLADEKLAEYEQEKGTFERRLSNMQNKLGNKEREIEELQRQMFSLREENQSIKSKRREDLNNERARWKRIMERHLAAKEAEHEDKMCFKEEILRQMRDILANVDANEGADLLTVPLPSYPPTLSETTESSSETSLRTRMKRRSDEAQTQVKYARTCSDIDVGSRSRPTTRVTVTQPSTNDFDALFMKESKASSSQRSVAIANLRHRRSRSSGSGVWVEHKPLGNLELNTVYQPTMKKRKSVSKLTKKDIVKNDKYLLEHQEQDSQGEIETQLYKADILPSAGGGAQVVFNDVEKLTQASPPMAYNLRKRSGGENINLREIEEKCSVAVECHGLPSKVTKRK